jgi:hypothetical protein
MAVSARIAFLFGQLGKLLFSPGSHFSLTSLACALLIATAFFVWQRVSRRRVRARTILRALFPKRILHSRSNEADIGDLFFNVFVFGVMFGWAVLSVHLERHHRGIGFLLRPGFAIDFADLRDPLRHHCHAVSRL